MKFTAKTVGELITELQKLDPAMQIGDRGSGEVAAGIEFVEMELLRFKGAEHRAMPVKWADKMPKKFFDKTFTALVRW